MPVNNTPQFGAERGEAGETGFTKSKKYNFANLYAMNRSDNALKEKVDEFQRGANSVNAQMADQVNKARSIGASNSGQPEANQSRMSQAPVNNALNQAKGISNAAQNYSVENEAMKAGQSPYQSAMAGFYAGVSNPYVQQIRSFSNLYDTALGKQEQINKYLAPKPGSGQAIAPSVPPKKKQGYGYVMSQEEADKINAEKPKAKDLHDNRRTISTAEWALKSGKITDEEYEIYTYRGPGSPTYDKAAYDRVVKKLESIT